MSDFLGLDRRGNKLLFPQSTWEHVKLRGHFDPGMYRIVMSSFERSTIVLDNPRLDENFLQTDQRKGDERYVSWVPKLAQYLVVPVIVKLTEFSRPGHPTIDPPLRIAVTAYPTPEIPAGKEIWKWPPNES